MAKPHMGPAVPGREPKAKEEIRVPGCITGRKDAQRLAGEEATPFIYCSVPCQRVNWVTLLLAPEGARCLRQGTAAETARVSEVRGNWT